MKQSKSNNINNELVTLRDKTIALYLRISREDSGKDESYSISNQKELLTGIAIKMGFTKILHFIDDGITGTSRDRKDFLRMMAELEKGNISTVMIKDLSRLGRDHIKMDWYIEEFFPEHDIRLISVGDGLDTAKGEDEFTPFRNLMNEWYARDISKKRKLTNLTKGSAGEPLGPPPYGYKKDPENAKRWVIDEEAASIVRRIFRMTLDGFGTEYIAATFEREGVLTPMNYLLCKGLKRGGIKNNGKPSQWNRSTVIKILSLQEYCGDVINFKTFSRSFKLKKRIQNDKENIKVFKDVHKPIISREEFERIQEKRGQNRKRSTKSGERSIFSGLLVCADCGGNLNYHFNYRNPEIKYFNCVNYNRGRKTCPTPHYIREDFLEQVILQEIRRLTKFATQYEDEFVRIVMGHSEKTAVSEHQNKQKEFSKLIVRDKELDSLFNKMYEDNASGKIDDERYARMTRSYSDEQAAIAEKIKTLRVELEKYDDKSDNSAVFLSAVRKYTRTKKLTTQMLGELIERIEVHQSEKVDGVNIQKLPIHYRCVGTLEIPDLDKLPQSESYHEDEKRSSSKLLQSLKLC